MPFSDFGIFLGDVSLWEINHFTKDPLKAQKSVLKKIVRRNKNCELGKKLRLGEVKSIEPIIPAGYKIPHIGWNRLIFSKRGKSSPVFKYISEGDYVYFVHSFAALDCEDSLIASAEYGGMLTAAVQSENIFGMQFHPEKSGEVGLKILKAFCEL